MALHSQRISKGAIMRTIGTMVALAFVPVASARGANPACGGTFEAFEAQ